MHFHSGAEKPLLYTRSSVWDMSHSQRQRGVASDANPELPESEIVEIDRSDFVQRHRYVCSERRMHSDWDKTNNHIWCRGCRRQCDAGDDVDPEKYEIYDRKREETIAWERVRLIE